MELVIGGRGIRQRTQKNSAVSIFWTLLSGAMKERAAFSEVTLKNPELPLFISESLVMDT